MDKNIFKSFKSFSNEKNISLLLFFLSIIFLIITISKINTGLFVDEAFSLLCTNSSYADIVHITAADVHPPLYYIILKFFRGLFSPFNIDPIILGNVLSVIPIVFLLIVSITKIKNEFGWITAGIFAFCITAMPRFMYHTVSIRMYSFAMFFVTMEFLYTYCLMKDFNLKNWSIVTIFAILASYTHYYGVISSIAIYLVLLLYIVYKHKKQIKNIILSGLCVFIAYIPWIVVVLSQIGERKGNMWITNMVSSIFEKSLWYYFSSYTDSSKIVGLILFLAIIFLIIYLIKNRKKDKEVLFGYSSFVVLILSIVLSTIVTYLIMPILVERYLFVSIGCVWLGFSILLSKVYHKKYIFIPILIILLCVGCVNTIYYVNSSDASIISMDALEDIHFTDNDVIIHDNRHVNITFDRWYASSSQQYTYGKDTIDYDLIDKVLEGNGKVYVTQKNTTQNFDNLPSKYKLVLIKTLKEGPITNSPGIDSLPIYIYELKFK